jgi:hypothetical protein
MADKLTTLAHARMAVANWMRVDNQTFESDGTITLSGVATAAQEEIERELNNGVLPDQFMAAADLTKLPNIVLHLIPHGNLPDIVRQVRAQSHKPTVLGGAQSSGKLLPFILFLMTTASVFFTGAASQDAAGNLTLNVPNGLMFAGGLMTILLGHEMGHYVVNRIRGEAASLPYFIPMPFGLFGTMGAVILQRAPFKNRRTLLEVGIAGPLVGFVLALPIFVIGLMLSEVKVVPTENVISLGDSLLTRWLANLVVGHIDTASGKDLFLHPLAMAGWIGFLITGMNLIPAGQLDGGHIAYALFGKYATWISYASIAVLLGLAAFVSNSWMIWALLLLLLGRGHPPVLDDTQSLSPVHYALALIGLIVLVLVFVPTPIIGA